MPSDSVLNAIVEYCRAQTVSGSPVKAYRDAAVGEEGGTPVVPPYAVVKSEGGPAMRDLEGNDFGPAEYSITVYAGSGAVARAIFDQIVYAAQNPRNQAGLEAPAALMPYLTGFSQAEVHVDQSPVERQGSRRAADRQFTVFVRFQVYATRS
jgi:hypothetical protein